MKLPTELPQYELTRNHRKIFVYKVLNIGFHFCRNSTIHGLNRIVNSRSLVQRVFWIWLFLSASVGLTINMYYLIEKYLEYPLLTNIIQEHRVFRYPDVSFCFTNPVYVPPVNSTQYKQLLMYYSEYQAWLPHQHAWLKSVIKFVDYAHLMNKFMYSHPAWSAIIGCKYLGIQCSHEDFIMRFLYPFGACYTFNSTRYANQLNRSMNLNREFELILYKSVDSTYNMIADPFESIWMPAGVLIMIHDQETWPTVRNSFAADGYTQIDMKIVQKHHLNINDNCRESRKYNFFDLYSNRNYTVYGTMTDCVFENTQMLLAKQCKCQWQEMQTLSQFHYLPFCATVNATVVLPCLQYTFTHFQQDMLDNCYRDDCQHTTFEKVVSQSKFPAMLERNTQQNWLEVLVNLEKHEYDYFGVSDLFEKAFLYKSNNHHSQYKNLSQLLRAKRFDLIDNDFIERNFMMVKIIPTSLYMDTVEEIREYPISRLFSDIGGCIGLWIGASLITIFEFFDLFVIFFEARIYPSNEKKRPTKSKRQISSTNIIKNSNFLKKPFSNIVNNEPYGDESTEARVKLCSEKFEPTMTTICDTNSGNKPLVLVQINISDDECDQGRQKHASMDRGRSDGACFINSELHANPCDIFFESNV